MISIITPSYNQARYLERTLQSVLSQEVSELEFIVIDGASQDGSVAILQHYALTHPQEMRYVSEKDQGQAHAVNKGLRMSRGDIIGWLNSDDIYYPHTLKKVLSFFENNPWVDVVYGQANHIDQNDVILNAYPTESWNLKRLKQTCFISQPAVFFRRRVLEQFDFLNEKLNFCMDYEYWLRMAVGGARFHYLPEILAGSRWYPETKTCSAPEKALAEAMQMLQQKLGYVPRGWLLNHAVTQVRSKSKLRKPQLRYYVSVIAATLIAGFRWNIIKCRVD